VNPDNPFRAPEQFKPETTTTWNPDRLPESVLSLVTPDEATSQAITPDAARELYRSRAYDHQRPRPRANPIYKLASITIGTAGNIITITAQQGSGKSSLVAAGLAATMAEAGEGTSPIDCLGLASQNRNGHAVIHIDTEQSEEDFDLLIRHKAIARVGLETPPPWLMSTELTGCSPLEILTVLETMMEDAVDQFGGVHSVWLDGVADAVNSPNDEQEAIAVVRRLHGLAIKHRCSIVCILHLNPGSDFKSRGHLGSQLERKAETVLQLKKATEDSGREVTTILATKTRHRPIPAALSPRFAWDDDTRMHRSIETKGVAQKTAREREMLDLATAVWRDNPEAALAYKEIVARLIRHSQREGLGRGGSGFSQRTAEERLPQMVNCGAIEKSLLPGHYNLTHTAKQHLRSETA
jgi:hypothetical protein